MTYALVRMDLPRMDLDSFARAANMHPDLVRRLVALGLLDTVPDTAGRPCLAPSQLAVVARIQRLRAGFAVNYASVGLVIDLLDRVAELEAALRARSRTTGG
ncbi:chaperone modulator CbpM [Microtetraspora niveoalba]|uniref:chaperone modulator CbpM n=1 Tax=Microtetraspora niveoalba TaxID=46175 RepID=UPI0008347849|nr:chaperone modulator CbpM [Microtetraspora niveoalba]